MSEVVAQSCELDQLHVSLRDAQLRLIGMDVRQHLLSQVRHA